MLKERAGAVNARVQKRDLHANVVVDAPHVANLVGRADRGCRRVSKFTVRVRWWGRGSKFVLMDSHASKVPVQRLEVQLRIIAEAARADIPLLEL